MNSYKWHPTKVEVEFLCKLDGRQPDKKIVNQPPLNDLLKQIIAAAGKSRFAIFGYASLMWKPGFKPTFQLPARIHGYSRQPCIKSSVYRGTKKRPGIVCGLDAGGSCSGLALGLPIKGRNQIFRQLLLRECFQGVYFPRFITARSLDNKNEIICLTFVANRQSSAYIPRQSIEQTQWTIRHAHGSFGSCIDYWNNTAKMCKKLGIKWHLKFEVSNRTKVD